MIRRSLALLAFMSLILLAGPANAQGYFEFLGSPRSVPDKFSPRHGIRYNTQGYDQPVVNWSKKLRKMAKKSVPEYAISQIIEFPGGPDAIGEWIDEAFDDVQLQFTKCSSLASRAGRVSPRSLYVMIMPSAFFEPYYKVDVAGVYYPSTHQIKVLNIYYIWSGPNAGWLRHARDLIKWEIGNFFATEVGVQPEPRPTGWPCNAPAR
ncbi:MAG TPA: hypothetical protein VLM38_12010 [Blastocatellia bacterium]|nr:hypothetical protein [Blastocatellia bacterium]